MDDNRNQASYIEENEIELFTLVSDVLKNALFIILGALATAMLTYVLVNVSYTPQYTASATFVVGAKDSNYTYSNQSSAYQTARIFQRILQSHAMEEILCKELNVDHVDAEINATVVEGMNMLILEVTAGNPRDAYDTIRVVIDNYSDISFFESSNSVLNMLVEPEIPFSPDNYPNVREQMKKAFVIGALACVFLFGILSYFKTTIKRESEIEQKLDARSLGSISYERKYKTVREFLKHKKTTILVDSVIANFSFVENYRKLASKLEYRLGKEEKKVFVVTSVAENEGKSTVAANLAITFAEQGKKVILIDGDLRRPSQFLIMGAAVNENNELGEYLKGSRPLGDILIKGDRKNLLLIGGRNCYSSSTEIVQSERLPKLIEACKHTADYVIIDTPPAGVLADANIFGQLADGVLLVARQNYIPAEEINEIIDDFRDNQADVLGVVLNGEQTFSNVVGLATNETYGYYGKYGKNKGR